jgi:hypothetical protein
MDPRILEARGATAVAFVKVLAFGRDRPGVEPSTTAGLPSRTDPAGKAALTRHSESGQMPVAVPPVSRPRGVRAAAMSLSGTGTDQVSGFGAGPTRDMAQNGLGEATIDTDVLPGDIAREGAYEELDHIRNVHGISNSC